MTATEAPLAVTPDRWDVTERKRRLRTIAAIKTTKIRAQRAAEFAKVAGDYAQELRTVRDQAVTALRLERKHGGFGWKAWQCYRLIDVPRVLFAKIYQRNKDHIDRQYLLNEEYTRQRAVEMAVPTKEWDQLADLARLLRDTTIMDLINEGMRNVDIATLTGLTEARIAQIKSPSEPTRVIRAAHNATVTASLT